MGVIIGCQQNYSDSTVYSSEKITLEVIDTVVIAIDSMTSNFNPMFQYNSILGIELLSIYNKNNHSIQIYDIESKRNVTNIELYKDGENAIDELMGFYIHNMDTIFAFSYGSTSLFLIDSMGYVKDKYKIDRPLKIKNQVYEMTLNGYFEISFDNNKNLLTFWGAPYIDRETSNYYKHPLVIDFDIKNNHIMRCYGYYPESYRGNKLFYLHEELNRTLVADYEIQHFNASHSFNVYDLSSKNLIKTIYAKSEYLPLKMEALLKDGDEATPLQKQRNYLISQGFYTKMIYDKKNKLTYRFVRHPQTLKRTDGLLNTLINRPRSVMIFDRNFNVAGEYRLPSSTFIDQFSFIVDGVIWVNINHPQNTNNDENELQFIRFKPIME